MDERLKLMLLLNRAGANASALASLMPLGISPRELWSPGSVDAAALALSEKTLARLRQAEAESWAERELERAERLGAAIVTIEDNDYPSPLFDLKDAPLVLYRRGGGWPLPELCVGVVGTRRASAYGKETARAVGADCAKYGVGLISGGAWGVDGCAQDGCASGGGSTFAVLGTGIDVVYPAANRSLFERICERGALISEFPIGESGEPWHFPQRNRIVAALSRKLVVVEAPVKSGSMITARLALELGREVWAVPGRITEAGFEGSNRLIFDGAYPYINGKEFFASCGADTEKNGERASDMPPLSAEEERIFRYLTENEGQTIDKLSVAVKMSAADILKNITLLSSKGVIFMSSPGRYSAKGNL
ncbi:MAG: DNA-processing protein DprA [Synergistaceae bacterium]|nr:DNA-processing protein DprA [Synergistaceae bacterium]